MYFKSYLRSCLLSLQMSSVQGFDCFQFFKNCCSVKRTQKGELRRYTSQEREDFLRKSYQDRSDHGLLSLNMGLNESEARSPGRRASILHKRSTTSTELTSLQFSKPRTRKLSAKEQPTSILKLDKKQKDETIVNYSRRLNFGGNLLHKSF